MPPADSPRLPRGRPAPARSSRCRRWESPRARRDRSCPSAAPGRRSAGERGTGGADRAAPAAFFLEQLLRDLADLRETDATDTREAGVAHAVAGRLREHAALDTVVQGCIEAGTTCWPSFSTTATAWPRTSNAATPGTVSLNWPSFPV